MENEKTAASKLKNGKRTDCFAVVTVVEEHQVALARQTARRISEESGFGRAATYYIATCVSELANNLFLHTTRGGTVTIAIIECGGRKGIEVVVEDCGPGIPDLEMVMRDGFSTNGGLGGGLPGSTRLMDEFEITSTVGEGTRIIARKWQLCS